MRIHHGSSPLPIQTNLVLPYHCVHSYTAKRAENLQNSVHPCTAREPPCSTNSAFSAADDDSLLRLTKRRPIPPQAGCSLGFLPTFSSKVRKTTCRSR